MGRAQWFSELLSIAPASYLLQARLCGPLEKKAQKGCIQTDGTLLYNSALAEFTTHTFAFGIFFLCTHGRKVKESLHIFGKEMFARCTKPDRTVNTRPALTQMKLVTAGVI